MQTCCQVPVKYFVKKPRSEKVLVKCFIEKKKTIQLFFNFLYVKIFVNKFHAFSFLIFFIKKTVIKYIHLVGNFSTKLDVRENREDYM